ncbi:MAG: HAD family phosphatase [Bacilli bacterium]|nr:HAD family phosphatase [Bacilli bacterium]
MIKMAVFDLDGTLLNSNLQVSEANLQAIKELRETGVRVVIATGRPEQLVKPYTDVLEMEDNLIMYNGSVIGHPFKEERLYSLALPKQSARAIIEYCYHHGHIVMSYTKDYLISKPNFRVTFFEKRNELLPEKDRAIFKDIPDLDDIIEHNEINKLLIIEKDWEKYKKMREDLSVFTDCSLVKSQNSFLDVNPLGASKGTALAFLAKSYGYKPEEIIAFGDQDNDVSMLEYAGTSVAMGNACTEAKNVADYITLSNDNDGVAHGIYKYILHK